MDGFRWQLIAASVAVVTKHVINTSLFDRSHWTEKVTLLTTLNNVNMTTFYV